MQHVLSARGQRATIIGATSGDTGAAAIAAFADLPEVDVFILYPNGRVSDVQRWQMTTIAADNVHDDRARRHIRRRAEYGEGALRQ